MSGDIADTGILPCVDSEQGGNCVRVYLCVCVCVSDKSVCMQFTSESKDQDRQRIYHHCMAASTEGKHTQSQKSEVTPGEHIGISLPIKPNSFTDTKYTNKTDPLTLTSTNTSRQTIKQTGFFHLQGSRS